MTSYFQQEIHATFCERQFWNQKASLIEGSLLKPQSDQLLNRLSIRTCLLHFPTFSLYNNTKQFPKNLPKLVWLPCQDCLEHNLWLLVLPFFSHRSALARLHRRDRWQRLHAALVPVPRPAHDPLKLLPRNCLNQIVSNQILWSPSPKPSHEIGNIFRVMSNISKADQYVLFELSCT